MRQAFGIKKVDGGLRKRKYSNTPSICLFCQKSFYLRSDNIDGKFCSLSCSTLFYSRGRKMSNSTKLKLSAIYKGCIGFFKGKHHTKKSREKISQSLKGRKAWNKGLIGELSSSWKGGLSTNKEHWKKLWKKYNVQKYARNKNANGSFTLDEWETLKSQYDYICPICNKKEPQVKLSIDHIIPVTKGGRNDIDNIIPLCKSCNSVKHNTKTIFYNMKTLNYEIVSIL